MQIQCPKCGYGYDIDHTSIGQEFECEKCHHTFIVKNPNLMPCPVCFKEVAKVAETCPHCGARLQTPLKPAPPESKPLAEPVPQERTLSILHPSFWNYDLLVVLGIFLLPMGIGLIILLWCVIDCFCTHYKITNLRVIVTKGWLSKQQTEIRIKDMRNVNLSQGIVQRMLGIGNVSIGTAATAATEILITGIRDPQHVVDVINAQRRI